MTVTNEQRQGFFSPVAALLAVAASYGCSADPADTDENLRTLEARAQTPLNIDPRLSLAITDQSIVEPFSLERVLTQLLETADIDAQTPTQLFQQWWDTQNPSEYSAGYGPFCDGTLSGYPYACRPGPGEEGGEATCNPFAPGSTCRYMPIGLFMRFDLAPRNGAHCGEYRIIYARESGRVGGRLRNLIIFEAALPNPVPNVGIRGCQKFIAEWADLSKEPDAAKRTTRLEKLYFDGFRQFDPVVQWTNFGENPLGAGQIRTNQFIQPGTAVWSLREFKLRKVCAGGCTLAFLPDTVKVNPYGPLFDPASTAPNAAAFQTELLAQVASLAANDVNSIGMQMDDAFNSGQSDSSGSDENRYLQHFGSGPSSFHNAIQAELTAIGSSLSPADIVARAQAMSCAGCHRLNDDLPIGGGLVWPASNRFTHVSERDVHLETAGGGVRFGISPALSEHFLPARKQLVEDYLNNVPLPAVPPEHSLSGRMTH